MIDRSMRFLPYAGANTMNASRVGDALEACRFVAVAFAGGMTELPYIRASQLVVNDLHRDVITLAACVGIPQTRGMLLDRLRWTAFHPDSLATAQQAMTEVYSGPVDMELVPFVDRAYQYFVSQWMGRSGLAGTEGEFKGKLPTRTNANGGGSAKRFWTMVRSLAYWGEIMRRCEFTCLDWKPFLETYGQDRPRHGIYVDAPSWPGSSIGYRHAFTEDDHRVLAQRLSSYGVATVVVRYNDHPLIRELYLGPDTRWRVHKAQGRKQSNDVIPEFVLNP